MIYRGKDKNGRSIYQTRKSDITDDYYDQLLTGLLRNPGVEQKKETPKDPPFEYHLTLKEIKPLAKENWDIKLLQVRNTHEELVIVVKAMEQSGKIAKITIQNFHKQIKEWRLTLQCDDRIEEERFLVEANTLLRDVWNAIIENHPQSLKLMVGEAKHKGAGNAYLEDKILEQYLNPIPGTEEEWKEEVESIVNEEYQNLQKKRNSHSWSIRIVPGERSDKMKDFLVSTGYFTVKDNIWINFNQELDEDLYHHWELGDKMKKWIKDRGVLVHAR